MTSDHGRFVDNQQVAIQRIVLAALEAAALKVHLQQPVDGLGLEAGRLRHALLRAAGRRAQQKAGAFGRKDAHGSYAKERANRRLCSPAERRALSKIATDAARYPAAASDSRLAGT
jgi:hypothetical protein